MKRTLQKWVIGAALRLVHAALVELRSMDACVAGEFERLPLGMSYTICTGHGGPTLHVEWDGATLHRRSRLDHAHCELHIKALPIAFRIFTGQMGMAQGYAQHAFTMACEVADVMRLAHLVNRTEAYLFPPFITKRFLTDVPQLGLKPLQLYGRLTLGFLKGKYS